MDDGSATWTLVAGLALFAGLTAWSALTGNADQPSALAASGVPPSTPVRASAPVAKVVRCTVVSVKAQPRNFYRYEQVDYGYQLAAVVFNKGEAGWAAIVARLSTSEGEYERKETLFMAKEAALTLAYDFPEPTLAAKNIQGQVSC